MGALVVLATLVVSQAPAWHIVDIEGAPRYVWGVKVADGVQYDAAAPWNQGKDWTDSAGVLHMMPKAPKKAREPINFGIVESKRKHPTDQPSISTNGQGIADGILDVLPKPPDASIERVDVANEAIPTHPAEPVGIPLALAASPLLLAVGVAVYRKAFAR